MLGGAACAFLEEDVTMQVAADHFAVTGVLPAMRAGRARSADRVPLPRRSAALPAGTDPRGTTRVLRVAYRQSIGMSRATYVLTSTQAWSSPLRRARLRVELAPGLEATVSPSLGAARRASTGGWTFEAEFRNWMPDADVRLH